MAHFAELDDNNIVTGVFVVNDDAITDENGDEQESLGQAFFQNLFSNTKTYKKCSYNTVKNKYWSDFANNIEGDQSKKLRANYPGIGWTYDPSADVFYAPKPYPSWVLNTTSYVWEAPVAQPVGNPETDNFDWVWDESTTSWIKGNF
jgi:hypothetical protein|tara:strand:+ start:371 stop:811 length:441 start_codon:yes stop_codon:yes gene_type:complete